MNPVVRLGNRSVYCSGVLVAPDFRRAPHAATRLVLTCAHYWMPIRGEYEAKAPGLRSRITAVRTIDGTDLALALLERPAEPRTLPGVGAAPRTGDAVVSWGFGGNAPVAQRKDGTVVAALPAAFSADLRTRVRYGAAVRNNAIKGDSGGPVMAAGVVVGIQSLIADPFGRNLGVATVAAVAPHLPALRAAAAALLD